MIRKGLYTCSIGCLFLLGCSNKNKEQGHYATAIGFEESVQSNVWVKKQDGNIDTIVVPESAEGVFETAELSPNKQFVLLTIPVGDGGQAWIYNVRDGKLHEIEGGFGLGEIGWKDNGRLMLHQGCIMATYCKKLESVSNTVPWVLEVTEDLGKPE